MAERTRALMARTAATWLTASVQRGVIERRAAERFRAGFDRVGRQMPLAQATLDLEFWARAMAGLEQASRSSSDERRLA
jgi:hypothetical protein